MTAVAFSSRTQSLQPWRNFIIFSVVWFSIAFIYVSKFKPRPIIPGEYKHAEHEANETQIVPTVQKTHACSTVEDTESMEDFARFAESKYGALNTDNFTIVMSSFQPHAELANTLKTLLEPVIPTLSEVVVAWNEVGIPTPEDYVSKHGVPVKYRASTVNSLNDKFRLDPDYPYRTRAIFLTNDNIYYKPADLEFAFQAWRKFGRNRITGAINRCSSRSSRTGKWDYNLCEGKKEYSMVLTNLAFVDISFLDYYSSDEDPRLALVREYVDEISNCEDIAMNFVVSMLTCEPPLVVKGRDPYVTKDSGGGIKPGHEETRKNCMNDFIDIFGGMPLVNERARIELGPTQ
ncbi:multiple-like 3 [Xylogone sp. PMI_703]|nr:multiple-like 3 [Xylogone sp. PMI_703]